MPTLTVRGPTGPQVRYDLVDEAVTIGRSASNTLVVFDPLVSRRHVGIVRDGARWLVEDLGSRNGTRVNGVPLEGRRALEAGDEIVVGCVVVGFETSRAPATLETPLASDWLPWSSRGSTPAADPVLVGGSSVMRRLRSDIEKVAARDVTVLVCGETGTGKEVVSRLVHRLSPRRDAPFVVVNCPALPTSLAEAELFGIERGVATGVERRSGRLETADGGTVLFDEMGDLELATQAKILRFLEDRTVEPVGGRKPVPLDLRLVAATNRDLEADVARGAFRRDLFHRLDEFRIELPPLRERREDVAPLVEHFLGDARARMSGAAMEALEAHDFPGNVRELRHAVARALVLVEGPEILPEHLPPGIARAPRGAAPAQDDLAPAKDASVDALRRRILEEGESFWEVVRDAFLRRDLSREDALRFVEWAWEDSGRSYRRMAELLGIPKDARRLENFLNRHDLKVERRRR